MESSKENFKIILTEIFYFLSLALAIFFVLEIIIPGIVLAYVNLNWILILWVIIGIIILGFNSNKNESE